MNYYFTGELLVAWQSYNSSGVRESFYTWLDTRNRYPLPVPSASPRRAESPVDSERYVIPNLRNACRILKLLGRQPDGLKAAELARALGIPVTTTLRIMTTLHLEGLARKSDGRFGLGPVLIQLGTAALDGVELRTLAQPLLQKLSAVTDETAHVAIPAENRTLIVAVQDSPHPLRAASRPGFMADLHCSSTGKTFLAFLYQDKLDELYRDASPARRTAHTLTTLAEIKREAALTRKRGYSFDDEEFNLGVRCLAAPVRGSDGTVVAAVGITAAAVRFTKDRVPEIAAAVKATAAELSHRLGYSSPES